MAHSMTSAGLWRPARVWALAGLWFVACLNPMPDDFPNHTESTVPVPPKVAESPAPRDPSFAGETDDGDSASEGSTGATPGAAGASGSSTPDAGAPEADAGP